MEPNHLVGDAQTLEADLRNRVATVSDALMLENQFCLTRLDVNTIMTASRCYLVGVIDIIFET